MSDNNERVVYQRVRESVYDWDQGVVVAVVNKFLKDRRTTISQEGASVGDIELINDRMLLSIEGVETPLQYMREVPSWLGPEFRWTYENKVYVDGSSENGATLAARACIEFDTAAADRTLIWRKVFRLGRLLLLICCIFTFGIFLTKLMRLWEGYERPWNHFFPFYE